VIVLKCQINMAEKFCLRWNDFESNINTAFRELREDKDFFDVTLACDDDQIQAHKVILSACSPFFRTILKRNIHEHPLLYLKGVKYSDLTAVLNFMYHGEVNVAQEDLNSFLAIAEDLKVKGLTQNKTDEVLKKHTRHPPDRPLPAKNISRQEVALDHPKPSGINIIQPSSSYQTGDDEIQEVVPVKTEPAGQDQPHHIQLGEPGEQSQLVDHSLDNSLAMYEDNYADYGNYEEGGDVMLSADNNTGNRGAGQTNPSPQERDNMFLVHMAMVMDGDVKKWQCVLCGKMAKLKGDILDHVECNHRDTAFLYSCRYCSKVVNTNRKLRIHEYQHRCNEKHGL